MLVSNPRRVLWQVASELTSAADHGTGGAPRIALYGMRIYRKYLRWMIR